MNVHKHDYYAQAVIIQNRIYRLYAWPRERWSEPARTYRLRFAHHIARRGKVRP